MQRYASAVYAVVQCLFQVFLQQTGGHRGGWDEIDHLTFLKYRNQHKVKLGITIFIVPVLLFIAVL